MTNAGNWDGVFYREIVTRGYEFARDNRLYDIAFFPLYPVVIWCAVQIGLGFDAAATLINNVCFLAALFVLYGWTRSRYGESVARWSVAVVGFFPLSLFGSVTYSEGMYLLLTSLTFLELDRRPLVSSLWCALASLTRPNGILLMPAFVIAAIVNRRPSTLLPALGSVVGMTFMTVYSLWRFGDALAFFHAQAAWRPSGYESGMHQWQILLASGTISFGHWLFQLVTMGALIALLVLRKSLERGVEVALWCLVAFLETLAWGRDLPFATLALLGGGALIWYRRRLGAAVTAYGLISLCVFVASGTAISVDRYLYAIFPFPVALGMFLEYVPMLAPAFFAMSLVDLYLLSMAFAKSLWVA